MLEKRNFNLLKNIRGVLLLSLLVSFFFSCNLKFKRKIEKKDSKIEEKLFFENELLTNYTGWWIYGEGQHIFKDEESLEEWDIEFSNENMQELKELYLAICEMEYFPMECEMIGHKSKDILKNETILIVSEFNILYIQGCGE